MRGWVILALCLAGPLVAPAMLPKDAEFRTREIQRYRKEKLVEFEKQQQQRDAQLAVRDQQIQQAMKDPPWKRSAAPAVAPVETESLPQPAKKAVVRSSHRWGFGISALLLIGGGVWWVRSKTETEPGL